MKKSWYIWPVISYLAVYASGLWMENGSSEFYDKIQPFFEASIPLVLFGHILAVLYIVHKNKIDNLQAQLDKSSAVFFNIYDELYSFKQIESLQKVLAKFIAKERYVHAVQLYRYKIKYHGNKVTFKINHVDGCVDERIPMNAMIQFYYNIDRKMYEEFFDALNEFDQDNPFAMIDFIQKYNHKLSERHISMPTDDDYYQYAFIDLCEDILKNIYDH